MSAWVDAAMEEKARREDLATLLSEMRAENGAPNAEEQEWARPSSVFSLDTGAFIAFERNDKRVRTLIELSFAQRGALQAPASVVAQVWRDGGRQPRVARLIGSGVGRSSTNDIVDAHVVLVARREGAIVVTSDPDDLGRIDADPGLCCLLNASSKVRRRRVANSASSDRKDGAPGDSNTRPSASEAPRRR